MRRITLLILALSTAGIGQAVGQDDRDRKLRELEQQLRETERKMRELRQELNDLRAPETGGRWRVLEGVQPFVSVFSNRARLGVTVRTAADEEADPIGAVIEDVMDDGPADEAGLEPGDIVTHFNGEALTGSRPRDGNRTAAAGMRLVDLAREVEEGDTVVLRYQRDGRDRTATVIARMLEPRFSFTEGLLGTTPRVEVISPSRLRIEPNEFVSVFIRGRWNDLELVTLDPDLGAYFGTTEGVLVVKAREDSPIDLKSGDVILTIGGRAPTSPTHALRILRNYEQGETVSVDVLRQQRRITITGQIPEDEVHDERVRVRPRRQSSL